MSLPRRVPWLSEAEFGYVYGLLFASEGRVEEQQQGLDRLHAWISRGNCPQAVESTAALLQIRLQDAGSAAGFGVAPQVLRAAYSMALTRFVNGLVDPLQQGSYAKSIAVLAQQLDLPLWFVELRHAATHEDLPSLEALRGACDRALDWIHNRYWLPQVQPSDKLTHQAVLNDQLYKDLSEQMRNYKLQRKESVRDVSKLRPKELYRACKAIEKVIVAAGAVEGHSNQAGTSGISMLLDALLEPGGLVPTSKKKRSTDKDMVLTEELTEIWMPLLEHFERSHHSFGELLFERIIETLSPLPLAEQPPSERGFDATLSAWLKALYRKFAVKETVLRESIVRHVLLHATPYGLVVVKGWIEEERSTDRPFASKLETMVSLAQQKLEPAPLFGQGSTTLEDSAAKLAVMEQREHELDTSMNEDSTTGTATAAPMLLDDRSDYTIDYSFVNKPLPIGALLGEQDHLRLILQRPATVAPVQ